MKIKIVIAALVVLMIVNVAALGSFLYLHHHARHQPQQLDRVHRWVLSQCAREGPREVLPHGANCPRRYRASGGPDA
jgi:hypothetical protein